MNQPTQSKPQTDETTRLKQPDRKSDLTKFIRVSLETWEGLRDLKAEMTLALPKNTKTELNYNDVVKNLLDFFNKYSESER